MRGRIACLFCTFFLFLSGCGPDVDVLLQNGADGSEDAEESEADGLTEPAGNASDRPEDSGDADASGDSEEATPEPDEICVYICGAVMQPGVYQVQDQIRLYELVDLAGGLREDAAYDSVNLAQTVSDGEMIRIPTAEEAEAGVGTAGSVDGTGNAGTAETAGGKVNINTAGADELMSLNGIGEVKAAAIVAYREEHGFFQSTEEIMEVSGIGEGTYDKIKEEITI